MEARSASGEERALPDAPLAVPDSWMEHMEMMFDLQVLALESDITRVISFKTGVSSSNRIFPGSGVLKAHHATSHHANNPGTIQDYNRINTYRLSAQRYLLEKLRDTTEAGVPLLDKTAIIWASSMSDPNVHGTVRCPLIPDGSGERGSGGQHPSQGPRRDPDGQRVREPTTWHRSRGYPRLRDSTGQLPLTPPGGRPATEIISRTGEV